MKKIRKHDTVKVLAGRSKGVVGKVLKVNGEKLLVEGVNIVKKHVKPNPNVQEPGGIKSVEAPIHVSNVALLNPESDKADRVGFKIDNKDGQLRKVRYFKSDGQIVQDDQ